MKEYIGKTFGRLTVVGTDTENPVNVVCNCSCGNTVSVKKYSLSKHNPTMSCGCLQREKSSINGAKTIANNRASHLGMNTKYGTNFAIIEKKTPHKNNKSGYTGVRFNQVRGKYEAYICLHRKNNLLGRFSKLQDAVDARRKAEQELFAPIIAAKYAEMNVSPRV